ncbi:NADP-dependent fatty aldehyde dehydrogenase (plasmid) [Hartmannibacter diazotrophicus]|uniref:NADP-dependent fatty aldehyde dehydrogenase n=1 Tax=Hartmannibacter diazotrophicus TaxID=1482074 RepID=A0A2C9DE59_9HYPH|nr:aldehyde dehydrogenase (NADP(+)) [Hartmannibacter diazotrophicus]SON58448.1 NADP-dependent fatty aldehyde dehydrogenase [Hartmannibacter diazotrophicus]
MAIHGTSLIGQRDIVGSETTFRAIEATTGRPLDPVFGGAGKAELEQACALAADAFAAYRSTSPSDRAAFLDQIGVNIAALGELLIERCMSETGLPRPRIEGERARTIGQLRHFADALRDGPHIGERHTPADPERKPLPRPDLRLRHLPLGPVAVFGASNFPLAFSVAGGDTASALAAGCPVVVKAHPAHPGTSELVGRAVRDAVKACALPEGVFSLLFGVGNDIGQRLVADPRIKAVGFTGSRQGGMALMRTAAERPEPIPVYAEMSSINPVFLFPAALATRGEGIGRAFAAALTLGAGQFCTNPGLVLAVDGDGLEAFIGGAVEALHQSPPQTMLTAGIFDAYCRGVDFLGGQLRVETLTKEPTSDASAARPALFATTAVDFLEDKRLHEEVFGAASLIVRCRDQDEMSRVAATLEGQLTIAIHIDEEDHPSARALLPLLETKAGRLVVNGFGTGVEVDHAMVHGGPFPATSDGRSTSVGSLAIRRFLRPVCYQNMPGRLLSVGCNIAE